MVSICEQKRISVDSMLEQDFHGKLPGGVGAKVPWTVVERSGALDELRTLWKETKSCMQMTWVPLSKCNTRAASRLPSLARGFHYSEQGVCSAISRSYLSLLLVTIYYQCADSKHFQPANREIR